MPTITVGAAIVVPVWAASVLGGWQVVVGCALGWALVAAAAIDARHLILPDWLTLPLIPAGLSVAWFEGAPMAARGIGATAGFLGFASISLAYRRLRGRDGLGLGDAKLLAGAGAWVAWQGLPSVVLVAALAALASIFGLRAAGCGPPAEAPFPFGPFLALGLWMVWLYGPLAIGSAG